MEADDATLLLAAAIGSGGLLTMIAQHIINRVEFGGRAQSEKAILAHAKIADELEELRRHVDADRILLVFTSNGGGVPKGGEIGHTTVMFEQRGEGLPAIKGAFQDTIMDENYVRVLRHVVENGGSHISDVSAMGEGWLKDLYITEGVQEAMLFPVFATKRKFYFVSLRWISRKSKLSYGNVALEAKATARELQRLLRI